jgi:hypothetical protein
MHSTKSTNYIADVTDPQITIVNVEASTSPSIFRCTVPASSSPSVLANIAHFLEAEDAVIVSLSIAPENVCVVAAFSDNWAGRANAALRGDVRMTGPPSQKRQRPQHPMNDDTKDMMDITQPHITIFNLDEETSPSVFRRFHPDISAPAILIWLAQFLIEEGAVIVSLVLSSKHLCVVTNLKDKWVERFQVAVDSEWVAT